MSAADTSVVVDNSLPSTPTIRTNTLDVIAADHAPAADWSNNSHKITALAAASAATDAASLANTLDQFAAPAANVAFNAKKITGLANGSAATDAAAFGQIPAIVWTLLSNTTLVGDGTFDVSSIDQTYNDLMLVLIARGTRVATGDFLQVRFNNDSGANQYDGAFTGGGAPTTSLAQTSGRISGNMPAASATASDFGMYVMELLGYTSTSWNKGLSSKAVAPITAGTTLVVEIGSVFWKSTAAVNRVQFFGGTTANLLSGSQLRIYGRL